MKQQDVGSQLRHSIALFHKKNARRTKPGVLSADYVVGLTDGEGSFTVYLLPPKKEHGSVSYRVQCRYYIKMREDELPLLEKVKTFWGCGKIYFQKEYRKVFPTKPLKAWQMNVENNKGFVRVYLHIPL